MEQTFTITGMTCGHCEASVKEEIAEIPGHQVTQISHATGQCVVEAPEVNISAVQQAVADAGYSASAA